MSFPDPLRVVKNLVGAGGSILVEGWIAMSSSSR
jgi:hypothetical protein